MAILNINHGARPQVLGKNETNYDYQQIISPTKETNIVYSMPETVKQSIIKIPGISNSSGSSPGLANGVASGTDDESVTIGDPPGDVTVICITEVTVSWVDGTRTVPFTPNPHGYSPTRVASVDRLVVEPVGEIKYVTDETGITDNTKYKATLYYSTYVFNSEVRDGVRYWFVDHTELNERTISVPKMKYGTSGDDFGGFYIEHQSPMVLCNLIMTES